MGIPDLYVMRPADCNETSGAYKVSVERSKVESMPTFLALTRQALPNLPNSSVENVMKGAYAVVECEDPDLILVATGSEVHLCVDAAKEMRQKVRVVSMPCWELFRAQPESYKEALLPKSVPKMSVEAAVTMGWGEWADALSASTSSAHRRLAARAWTDSASMYLTLSAVLNAASEANEVRSLMVPRPSQRQTRPGSAQALPKSCPAC